jgi:nucleotide-binding universal stress UspA family protein
MSWKEVLVHVDGESDWRSTAGAAAALATRFGAHLVGLGVLRMPDLRDGVVRRGMGHAIFEQRRRDLEEAAGRTRDEFSRWGTAAGLGVEWRTGDGEFLHVLALHARYADLVVVGTPSPHTTLSLEAPDLAAEVVLAAGRPVLVVPAAGAAQPLGRRIAVAWNASREAARAVTDALPLIEGADHVVVLIVRPKTGAHAHGPEPGVDVAHYLARHGTDVEVVVVDGPQADVGDVLLRETARLQADLLVMGAYGHSRLRELVLGGATRTALERRTLPLLMSH